MKRIMNLIFPLVFIVMGVVVIVICAGQYRNKDLYDMPAKGVITDIQEEWNGTDSDGFDEYTYTVFVDYEVDGKKYEHVEFPFYSGSMKVGDEIDLLYQSADPTQISETNAGTHALIFIAGGALFVLLGIVFFIKTLIRR